ncbi:MAG: ComEC/Rec2 family competence protein [Candidatus Bipolaricaulis sp.]|nr:ComEC/Rec2 family competence protein [Candidatus Bipolaricaulis sp.]
MHEVYAVPASRSWDIIQGKMTPSFLYVAISFAVGILLARMAPFVPGIGVLWGLAVGVALLSVLLARFRRGFLAGLWISVAILGALRASSLERSYADLYHRASFFRELTGSIVSYPDWPSGVDLGSARTAFVFAPDRLSARVRVTVFWGGEKPKSLTYGDRLRLRGSVEPPPKFADFDYRAYLAEQGVFAVMRVDGDEGIEHLGVGGMLILRAGNALRDRLLRRLEGALSAQNVALARGLLFGDTTGLSSEVDDAFRRTGLSHVLAVSGLHLAVLLSGLWFALRRLGLRPCAAYPIVGASVLLILGLVGLPVSLVRAAVMFGFLALGSVLADLGRILRRSIRPSHGLAAAGLLILAIRPAALFDVGFQLSFGATAAILAWVAVSPRRMPSLLEGSWSSRFLRSAARYGTDLAAISMAAQAGTAPFLAWHFGMLYPLGLLANLVAVPLATLSLWVGVIALLLCATPLFSPMATLFGALLTAMTWIVEGLSRLPLAAVAVDRPLGIWLAAASLYTFAAVYGTRRTFDPPSALLDTSTSSR